MAASAERIAMERHLNPEHVRQMLELVDESPFMTALNIKTTALGYGFCRGEVDVEPMHMNAFGGIHGGMYAAMMDHISYWALYGMLDPDMGAITLDLNTTYLRACDSGHLVAEGRVIKAGRQIALCEVEVKDETGRLMAHGTSKMMCSPTLQPASAVVEYLRPGLELPTKFLDEEEI
jgi:uncharacterized protein (TIGR00369 family)